MTNYDNPPSYDSVTEVSGAGKPFVNDSKSPANAPTPSIRPPAMSTGPSYSVHPATTSGPNAPVLYHYQDPLTQETVVSLLPPDHPEMICLQAGAHDTQTHFGILGVLAAVFFFPLGVGLCILDRRVKCKRCGKVVMNGMCD